MASSDDQLGGQGGAESAPSPKVLQLASLAAANVVVLLVAWMLTRAAGTELTAWFVAPEFVVVIGAVVICGLGLFVEGAEFILDDATPEDMARRRNLPPEGFEAWWLMRREGVVRWVLLGLAAVMVFALDRLVHTTGGGLLSPFVPLLTAPAVFGPFLAKQWQGSLLAVAAVSAAIIYEVTSVPNHAAHAASVYSPGYYAIVTISVLGLAGATSSAQRWRRTRLQRRLGGPGNA